MSEDTDYLWEKRHKVLYRLELSTLYHQKRERFFAVSDKFCVSAGLIGGAAALASLSKPAVLAWIALTITIVSAISLIFGFSDRSKRHADLARDFRILEADIVSKGERDFTDQDLSIWESKTRMLESSEPPALATLVILCQNELALAQGHSDHIRPIGRIKRLTAHFFS